jgi:hypothetical protein
MNCTITCLGKIEGEIRLLVEKLSGPAPELDEEA